MSIRPVILSGGSGTRLWPASRAHYPKQFAPLAGDDCLFANTMKLVADRTIFGAPIIISNVDHKFLILDVLDRLQIKDATILLEPMGRNTAAAAMIAALAEKEHSTLHLVLPSDHIIKDRPAFFACIRSAEKAAKAGAFALFGIKPEHPETGFGYIVPEGPSAHEGVLKIKRFTEKPDAAKAASLIQEGALWNSGIFFYAAQTLLNEAATLAPEHLALCRKALEQSETVWGCQHLAAEAYQAMGNHPIDKLIMEKTSNGTVVPCSMGWSDVGSWQALGELYPRDENGNATEGDTVLIDTKDCFVKSYGPAVAVIGGHKLTVVATKDAVMISPTDRSQQVKDVVTILQERNDVMALEHPKVHRPWGSYESIAAGDRFQVKHIIVAPGKALSLQMHHHRAEHWVVVAGTAAVECNGEKRMVAPNESVYIPCGATHRLTNPGKLDLHLIEVQSGDYLGEDDIVRLSDTFGRDK